MQQGSWVRLLQNHLIHLLHHDVVKTTIFITDMNRFGEINEVYGKYFTSDFPARETVQVSALPKFVNVEISMIAVK